MRVPSVWVFVLCSHFREGGLRIPHSAFRNPHSPKSKSLPRFPITRIRIRIQKINILLYVVYFKFKIDFRALTTTLLELTRRPPYRIWKSPRVVPLICQGVWGLGLRAGSWELVGVWGRQKGQRGSANYDPQRSRK